MNSIIKPIRLINIFFVAAILILLAGYFVLLHYLGKILPLPAFLETKRIYVNILAIGFLVILPALLVANNLKIVRIVFSILLIPLCCFFSYLATVMPERILDSTELGSHRYQLTIQGAFAEIDYVYNIYKCNFHNLECEIIYTDIYRGDRGREDLIAHEKIDEVHFLRRGDLIYAYGKQPREVLKSEQFGNSIYYVSVYPPYGSSADQHTYMLYKCQNAFSVCQQLPFHYTDTGGTFKLSFDGNTKELKLYKWGYQTDDAFDTLIYSYSMEPKCYVERCSVPAK